MRGIFLADQTFSAMRSALLTSAPSEAAALLLAGRAGEGDDTRLLVREYFAVPPESYQIQEQLRVVIDPAFIMPLLKKARGEQLSLVLTHTHPFAETAHFSQVDDEGEQILMPVFFPRTGDSPHGALLLTAHDATGRIWTSRQSLPKKLSPVVEVGRSLRIHDSSHRSQGSELPQQFDRSVRALGREGQATLALLSIGIVGLGGMGSVVAEQLAHLGVGSLVLLDPDTLEETNLNRVVGATRKDLGRPKVEIAADAARRVNPRVAVTPVAGDVIRSDDARRLLSCDLLFLLYGFAWQPRRDQSNCLSIHDPRDRPRSPDRGAGRCGRKHHGASADARPGPAVFGMRRTFGS
jgi:molybdopterin-synthase adenylyltransferase